VCTFVEYALVPSFKRYLPQGLFGGSDLEAMWKKMSVGVCEEGQGER